MKIKNSVLTPEKYHDVDVLNKVEQEARIMLINDSHNNFTYVIECLIKYCKHDLLQAEQCATLVHYKGVYPIKEGLYNDLLPIHHAMLDAGLLTEID